jgi:hypothetical protein
LASILNSNAQKDGFRSSHSRSSASPVKHQRCFSDAKKQDKTLLPALKALILSRLGGKSAYAMPPAGHLGMDENTLRRLMSNPFFYGRLGRRCAKADSAYPVNALQINQA